MSCSKKSSTTIRNSLISAAAILTVAWYSADAKSETPVLTEATTTAATAAAALSPKAEAVPAIWKASDADTNVYLFGTIHLLKESTKWESAAFSKVFDEASAIYLEADVSPEAQSKLAPIVQKYAFLENGETLSGVLGDQSDVVQKGAQKLGLPFERMQGMKPWFVAVQFAGKQMIDAGYTPGAGVDAVIAAKAKAAQKPMRFFESVDEQLTILSSFPMDGQVRVLARASKEIQDKGVSQLDELVDVWKVGDVDGLNAVGLKDMVLSTPEAYNKIIVNRNANWTEQIKDLMDKEAGTFLVAVGALHLAGDDSVVKMLEASGVSVARQ
ncbi:TraB/GumN family protein [Kordiimonas sp. SCSIO 12610]|uniref:TraB/GumN family protein n=1 Tax=Kordiimonas sp. SCSIO 12610 TaxID=2829597 RepID=UPI00210C3275|nr:TraB/GumN family protein [Kordiimonas sp. SCSIO 12610]UTW56097.1 TraB/GumN family protein [Kordiimonas sp. SCSIO 12610]